jgi:hypothetical protein
VITGNLAALRAFPHRPRGDVPAVQPPAVVPYDCAAQFELTGRPGHVHEDVINIAPDAEFVATAIGYGFDEERGRELTINLGTQPAPFALRDVQLGELPPEALIEGFRVNPEVAPLAIVNDEFSASSLPVDYANRALQRVRPVRSVTFMVSLIDSSSGRELQAQAEHSLAALGSAKGERPFRPLARPCAFMPRSTIRVQVEERSYDTRGTLFVVLFGYKMLAARGCTEPVAREFARGIATRASRPGFPEPVIPFDYVVSVELSGRRGERHDEEVPISTDGGFVATAMSYGLAVDDGEIALRWQDLRRYTVPAIRTFLDAAAGANPTLDLALLPLSVFPAAALCDGIRIKPEMVRLAFARPTMLATQPRGIIECLFETLNRPEDVSFRYALYDTGSPGSGDWQNMPIHSLAGLGAAGGERPFKQFASPMVLLPRSTIRVGIEERSGRGTLFLVFQGYKYYGAPLQGARP